MLTSSTQSVTLAARPTILVIDDDEGVSAALDALLQSEGYQVAIAKDGREGLAAYAIILPDLVITDIVMPDVTGIAVITGIKRITPAAKVIAMSGGKMGAINLLELAKEIGASATISKPFNAEKLLGAVRSLLPTPVAVAVEQRGSMLAV